MADVSQLLAELPAHFACVAPSVAVSEHANTLARQLFAAALERVPVRGGTDDARLQQ